MTRVNIKTEIVAGVTTFFTLFYIIIVNPSILSSPGTGMPFQGVLTATVTLSFLMTLLMGCYARLPFAVAPGMGINAFFAFTIILGNKVPWPVALGIIFWVGVIFLITSITPIRTRIANAIPENLRIAASAGIGMFLTFIGLKNAGFIAADPVTFVRLGSFDQTSIFVLAGSIVMIGLLRKKNPFAFLAGISLITFLAYFYGHIHLPKTIIAKPDFTSVFLKLDILGALKLSFLPAILSIFFTNLFDSLSTFMGCSHAAGLKDESGNPLRLREGLIVDAWAALCGGLVGTGSGTAFVESIAGMEVGGRTGLTAVVTAFCFLPFLFLGPLVGMVPLYATAPVLILVGCLMFRGVKDLKLTQLEDLIPAFLTLILIPFTFSITQGILWGLASHVVLFALVGRRREVPRTLGAICAVAGALLLIENFHVSEVRGHSMNTQLIQHAYKKGEVTLACEKAISSTRQQLDEIARIPVADRQFKNTLLKFEQTLANFSDTISPLTFLGYVSTSPEISKEASDCEAQVNQFLVSVYTRKDLYESIRSQGALSSQEERLLKETLKEFEDNGLKLSDDKLKRVRELKQKLAQLESDFSTNLNKDETTIELSADELVGVPKDFLDSLKKTAAGKFIVTTKEPHYIRVMENVSLAETRRKTQEAYENRAAANTQLLESAIQLRQEIAQTMGFNTWADYRVHSRMAKDSKTISKFLGELKLKLASRNREDLNKLLKLKRESDPSAKEIKAWDIRYFSNQLKKRDFALDDEYIREFFPSDVAVAGLFEVYSKLLGVSFVEEKGASVWAENVKLFKIVDKSTDKLVGYFYMDFIPRPGKYGHAAAFTLKSGRLQEDGTYSHPVSAIVANFSPPENGKPSLLKHEEVRTLFHEFGHIMHQTLTRAPYASLSGSSVDRDFVEAPSQMLENWVFSEEVLASVSGHYLDHSRKLPQSVLEKLVEARNFNQGYFYTRQLVLALLDLTYHTSSGPVSSVDVYKNIYKELTGIEAVQNSHFPASFGHLMGGYDAGYYGYLWSEVYADDMFTRFKKEGLLNYKTGEAYRRTILEQGKMVDGFKLLREFLGREPNADAFYKRLRIVQ